MNRFLYGILFVLISFDLSAGVVFEKGKKLTVVLDSTEPVVVHTALGIFKQDYYRVFKSEVIQNPSSGAVYIGTIGSGSKAEQLVDPLEIEELKVRREGFLILEKEDVLIVLGNDKRGTAYGIMELSRLIGVSPWEWWADSVPSEKERITIDDGYRRLESPSVAHRGIFINDEDWGLTPWSYKTNDPSPVKGRIGPGTHERIFELLLRLRANTFWPAMHDCSEAFYLTPGNKETADKYAIFIGTSHCEPMMRNTNAEWKLAGNGAYNYVTNRENILRFWEKRTSELAGSDNIYTLGIRGVHDSKMLGANTLQEQKEVLDKVLKDQREMIGRYINPEVEQVSQVFIPYKEVLDVYHLGLEVPQDITLLWCDDNYGYIRHFPDSVERQRGGGNGIYYHVSYWGRPHDYLWLATHHPAQIYTQMRLAYEKGAKQMWILNVGDIKPGEYLTELFLDMAWNIDAIENSREGLQDHLQNWMQREFGQKYAGELAEIMNEYYRLAYIRKPEFMGNTRTEEKDSVYKIVKDLPWSESEIRERITQYETLAGRVNALSATVEPAKRAAWFQLVEYPVLGACAMNQKHLYGQLARHGKADWALSDAAYDRIEALTGHYNSLSAGKWRYIMDFQPRRLAVFERIPRTCAVSPLKQDNRPDYIFNGVEFLRCSGEKPLAHGLGYQSGAVSLFPGSTVEYTFEAAQNIRIEVCLVPNHPVDGKDIRYAISLDGGRPQEISFRTEGRSEEWKQNVLRNRAVRISEFKLIDAGQHTLSITALDEGVILDQVKIWKTEN